MKSILIIDDDLHIGNVLEELLAKEGYRTVRAYSGTEAVLVLRQERPDLVLLDLMLPGLSGEEVLEHIKGIPVIVLSAKVEVEHKVELLLGGAVDYVTKPFHTKELLARIAAQLRAHDVARGAAKMYARDASCGAAKMYARDASCGVAEMYAHDVSCDTAELYSHDFHGVDSGLCAYETQGRASVLIFEDLMLDTDTHIARVGGAQARLTRTEYAILKLLMQNPSQVITKSQLLERISVDTPDCTESSLKMHISNLRRKLRDAGGGDYIESVWGIGFKMKEE